MMPNTPLPDKIQRRKIEAEAARLVVLLDECDDPADRAAAQQWIASHPYHGVAYAAAADVWLKGERLRLRGDEFHVEIDDDAAADMASDPRKAHVPGENTPHPAISRRGMTAALLGAAAATVAGIGLAGHFRLWGDHRATQLGQRETAQLSDGSSIAMNSDTSLDVLIDGSQRKVRLLRGEAMFDIAKDVHRPFYVDLGDSEIKVLGTKFNIRRRDGVTELAVTEGVVLVANKGADPVKVHAGSSAVIRPGVATSIITDPGIVQQRIAWTEGFLEFEEEPLEEVVEEFNRYRKIPLTIGDPRIAGTLITGRFGLNEGDEFVLALESSFDIRASKGANGSVVLLQSDSGS